MKQSPGERTTYRTATAADAHRIAALHACSWQQTYRGIMPDRFLDDEVEAERLEVWQERFAAQPSNREIIVAEADGQLVGFACVVAGDNPVYGALLDNLHVAGDYKGRGIGRSLIKRAAEWVAQRDATSPFFCGSTSRTTQHGRSTMDWEPSIRKRCGVNTESCCVTCGPMPVRLVEVIG